MTTTLKIINTSHGKGNGKYIGKTLVLTNGYRLETVRQGVYNKIPCEAGEADAVHYDSELGSGKKLTVSYFKANNLWFIRDHNHFRGTWVTEFEAK